MASQKVKLGDYVISTAGRNLMISAYCIW